ncbi:ABC transporter ATP-binding protein [Spirosoma montaniterrae]|uniref:ABC transporter ATP-binding protein n=2 Tax=Spirosoma montaniterrae TaxID=1178516 RepID=A0A1P9X4J7_9BACT|nr:ABC transporter ATP-binding protein [Spirosoma montaniterrae]
MDCGPTCLRMLLQYYDKPYSIQYLRELTHKGRGGVSMLALSDAAEQLGLHTLMVKVPYQFLLDEPVLPAIAYFGREHFVVIHKIKNDVVYLADPAIGLITYGKEEFCQLWLQGGEGYLLLLEPTPDFYARQPGDDTQYKRDIRFLFRYLTPYRRQLAQVMLGLFTGTALSLMLPFLTQSVVDVGIQQRDLSFIYVVLGAQLMLFIGKTSIDLIRSWLLMHLSSRINIRILSDFLTKLMRLPIGFFDAKSMGDLLQRMRDQDRIKDFLTSSSLDVLFSLVQLVVLSIVLMTYSLRIWVIFGLGSVLFMIWTLVFMKRRKVLDYKRFRQMATVSANEVQLVQAMPEIKLHNCEKQKRWEWEDMQAQLYRIDMQGLRLAQWQSTGGAFINELKNIVISFFSAYEVIQGHMTLGMMLAATYILGQINGPIISLISFIQQAQDAGQSLERLSEIHNRPDEDANLSIALPPDRQPDIRLTNVTFRYGSGPPVLNNISLTIPAGQTTAIVGASGSGKTTLVKLLLKFYQPASGEITVCNIPLTHLNSRDWRERCGSVMQDGFIFSDTIARNIVLRDEVIDKARLLRSVDMANAREFIEALPLHYNTRIGGDGVGLSQGQKQRLLIARAIYYNPDMLFFDEATSSLDASNEKEITDKLATYLRHKTAVVIAHRLSTVKNADQIIVLDRGEIREVGTHASLVQKRGLYFELVRNQLELDT